MLRRVATSGLLVSSLLVAGCSPEPADDAGVPEPATASSSSPSPSASEVDADDFAAVADLMDVRARALLHGRRKAFLATLDTGDRALRSEQADLYANVQSLDVGRLFYSVGTSGLLAEPVRGDDPVLRPEIIEHLSIPGTFDQPIANALSMTFVRRDGRWLLGREVVAEDNALQERPWFGRPIDVARADGLVVLADGGATRSSAELVVSVGADLAAVDDVLDESAPTRLLVDATTNGLPRQLSNASGEDAGAVSFRVFSADEDGDYRTAVGDVVKLNPDLIDSLVERPELMRHELTHYRLDEYGTGVPIWASEGIAEYVGAFPQLLSLSLAPLDVVQGLSTRPVELTPSGRWGDDPELDYLVARASCEYLVTTYGLGRYLEMMRVFDRAGGGVLYGEGRVAPVLRRVYGVGEKQVARGTFDLLDGLAG